MPRSLLLSPLLGLPLALACGDKDTDGDGDGGATDGGSEDCTLDLAPAGEVSTDPSCEAVVDKLIGMEIEWQWTGLSEYPSYNGVFTTPAVGDVDGDGQAEIVFTALDPSTFLHGAGGLLVIIDGATGETEAWFDGYGDGTYFAGEGSPAIADIDGDGAAEILAVTTGGAIAALRADGTGLFETAAPGTLQIYGQLGVADFDGDGVGEVYGGGAIFGVDGGFEEGSDVGGGGVTNSPAAGDLDGDGVQELVVGNQAFTLDGELVWDASKEVPDMAPAIADFDGDGKGEVVGTDYSYSGVWMLDDDGSLSWAVLNPGYYGGPPCVADFDGDGAPEIGVAGFYSASVLDGDGTVLWSVDIIDGGYGTSGCAAFDFDDDGEFELVLADDDAVMVVAGSTGEVLLRDTGHAGLTINAHPVVADVDGDGRTELIVGSNQYNDSTGWTGITALRDVYDAWSPTRAVWNQSAYYPGAIGDDLGLPAAPEMPWDGQGAFRANEVYDRGSPMAPAANLVALASDTCIECSGGLLRFEVAVQVANQGATDVTEPIGVGVYAVTAEGRRELVTAQTLPDGLAAGRSSDAFAVDGQFATAVGFTHLEVQVGGNEVRLDAGLPASFDYLECNAADDVAIVEFGCEE